MRTNPELYKVVKHAYIKPFSLASNFARLNLQGVAAAASLGLISTLEAPMMCGRIWRITGIGLQFIKNGGHL